MAFNLNLITRDKLLRIYELAKSLGLPIFHKDFTDKKLIETSLKETKAHRNGNLNLPVPSDIGKYIFINELPDEIVVETIQLFISPGH